jgi:hypothetical protein
MEQCLSRKTAKMRKLKCVRPGENRRHKAAAQRVLSALLPETGTSIKGAMRTKQELLKQSGYIRRPDQFSELLDILDKKLRLVTPTDPVIKSSDDQPEPSADAERRYQLTHDYLVPSLREWLTSKKKETRRGRAELRLAERSESWTAKPENRHLPSLWEFLNIRLLTDRKNWTGQQRKMTKRAGRVHAIQSGIVAAVLVVASLVGISVRNSVVEKQNATRAEGLVDGLVKADIAEVPSFVSSLEAYRTWADPLLKQEDGKAEAGSKQKLHMAIALLPVDESKVNYLRDQLLVVTPTQFPVVRDALLSHKDAITTPPTKVQNSLCASFADKKGEVDSVGDPDLVFLDPNSFDHRPNDLAPGRPVGLVQAIANLL